MKWAGLAMSTDENGVESGEDEAASARAGDNAGATVAKPHGRPSAADWNEARSDFEAGKISLRALAARMGVARRTVTRRAEKDGWLSEPDARAILKAGDPHRVEHLVNRLYRAFDMEINRLEKRLGVGAGEDAAALSEKSEKSEKGDAVAEAEKTARTLSSLARTLDTLIELRAALPPGQQEAEKDEDALRQELAERFLKMCGPGEDSPVSVEPRGSGVSIPEA
jgi:hypothetical protein